MSRIEKDPMGEVNIPDDALYGAQTVRALDNFPVSGYRARTELITAYVMVKKAAIMANTVLGGLDEDVGMALISACDNVLGGGHADQFPVDVFQAGAGTSLNMNVNEVLANIALELMGKGRGEYGTISPNDHVNMGQSTNDTYPTASHVAIIWRSSELRKGLRDLVDSFDSKASSFKDIVKSGRTHLMDALPVTIGHEFGAYAMAMRRAEERISQREEDLLEVAIGGTAVGTGANTSPGYRPLVISNLSVFCHLDLFPARDSFEALQSRSLMMAYSSSLRELAIELGRICNDLRLLGSGPTTGLAEISLPPVQPGSSMMPGKVNPSMAECMNMICFQIVGNDTATANAAQAGQLDLNVMTPVMTFNILESLNVLVSYLPVFRERCIDGIKVDEVRCASYALGNPIMATFLSERIGYLETAGLVKESMEIGIPVQELAVRKGLISESEARSLFDLVEMARSRYD